MAAFVMSDLRNSLITSAVVACFGVSQIYLQLDTQRRVEQYKAELQQSLEARKLLYSEKISFVKSLQPHLDDIDNSFYEICFFGGNDHSPLLRVRAAYMASVEKAPIPVDSDIQRQLLYYSEVVAEAQFAMATTENASRDERMSAYQKSKEALRISRETLEELLRAE